MNTERQAYYKPGPRFFEEEGELYFEFTIDGGNKMGPRLATDEDKEKYPEALKAMADEKKQPAVAGPTPGLKEFAEREKKEKADKDAAEAAKPKAPAKAPTPSPASEKKQPDEPASGTKRK